jgi:hypothetical protein
MAKLTDTAIRGDLAPGKYGDGDGLWLVVSPTRAKSFVFRFKVDGKERNMGLGPYPALTLAKARAEAQRHCRARAEGKDPLELREEERALARLEAARNKNFKETAAELIASRQGRWKNDKHKERCSWCCGRRILGLVPVRKTLGTVGLDLGRRWHWLTSFLLVSGAGSPGWTTSQLKIWIRDSAESAGGRSPGLGVRTATRRERRS